MTVMDLQKMREEKLQQLREGKCIYAESQSFIRMMLRGIEKENLKVIIDRGHSGYWFIPIPVN